MPDQVRHDREGEDMDIQKIRQDFRILTRKISGKSLIYFDNAATSQKPKQVIEALVSYYENHNANVHRGIHTLSEEATEIYEEARKKVAGFIGMGSEELIFVRNTTEAINLVAYSWGSEHLGKGDLVLTTEMEHHSNIVPWQQFCKLKSCRLEFVKVTDGFLLDLQDLEEKLSRKPKLLCVTHVSNVLGTINPIKEIVKRAHKKGVRVLVDGAQSVPHMRVNVKDLDCDFFAFSGHKMLGPMGIGGLFIKREIMEKMGPFLTGGGMITEVVKSGSTLVEAPMRFEAGTPNVAGAVGLAAAVDYLEEIGMKNIYKYEQKLIRHAIKKLKITRSTSFDKTQDRRSGQANEKLKIKLFGPEDINKRVGVITFVMDGVHAHDVAQILDNEGIAVRAGHHCAMPLHQRFGLAATVRVSFYLYNTKEEIDAFVEALEKVRKIFGN